MKRSLCVILAVLLAFGALMLAACQKAQKKENEPVSGISESKRGPVVSVSTDCTGDLKPGDTFTLTFNLSNAELLACFNAEVSYDGDYLKVERSKGTGKTELTDMLNSRGQTVVYGGYVMTTTNIENEDIFTVKFTVYDDITEDKDPVIRTEITQYLIGTDADGAKTVDLTSDFAPIEITVPVRVK